jgi:hypothetical protein
MQLGAPRGGEISEESYKAKEKYNTIPRLSS